MPEQSQIAKRHDCLKANNITSSQMQACEDDLKNMGIRSSMGHQNTSWLKHNEVLASKSTTTFKLVIFDKDGTLVCFHSMWGPWCVAIANKLQSLVNFDVIDDVYKLYNYDPNSGRIGKGSLAEDTHDILRNSLLRLLVEKHSVDEDLADEIVEEVWKDSNSLASCVKATCDVKSLFEKLRSAGIKIAVCTSDDRKNTLHGLSNLGVTNLTDYILCGDDPHNVAKPAPHNVHHICQKLNVSPSETIVIGDTPADTCMGKRSGTALVVGVLTGVCQSEDLYPEANVVVDNIEVL